ncbi:UNVERIFIED_CONTAM: hypothetical protein HDU68_010691 [Siphonaria sp. JEL0065]|nr:hypothetical protein HDU68_010691 [Siphonaria sp. JEL0065]
MDTSRGNRGRGRGRGRGGRGGHFGQRGNEGTVDYNAMDQEAGISTGASTSIVGRGSRYAALASEDGGDVNMDGSGNVRNNRSSSNPYGVSSRGSRGRGGTRGGRFPNMSLVRPIAGVGLTNEVSVLGWKDRNPDPVGLFDFLKAKIDSTTISIVTHRFDGDAIIIKFKSPIEVNAVAKLSGIRYIGSKLIIQSLNAVPSASLSESQTASITQQPNVIALLTEVLQSRYNPEGKFVTLENLPDDPRMQSNPSLSSFGSDSQETNKIGPVICKLIGQLFPDVRVLFLS